MANTNPEIPVAGTPGIFDPRNPTLVPNFDIPVTSSTGDVTNDSPANFLVQNPRADALATATIGGTVTTGDKLALVLANPILSGNQFGGLSPAELSFEYTAGASDTVNTIAAAFADLINDNAFAQALNARADVTGAVLSVHQEGPIGNLSTLTAPLGQPSKITVGGTALTGDEFVVLFAGPALGPVAPATAEVIITGTSIVVGDTVALTFTNASVAGFPITKTYTCVAGDTPVTIATGLRALINGDTTLGPAGMQALPGAGNVLEIQHLGAVGNSTVLTDSIGGTGNEAIAFLPANGHLSGGTGQPGGVVVTSATTTGQNATTMGGNLATAINANADLAAFSITGSNSSGVVSLTVPAAAEPLAVTAWVNTIAPASTIAGTAVAGDVLNLIFTAPYLPGGAVTATYTAVGADNATTMANGLVAAINANAALAAAGITATNVAGVITYGVQNGAGQLRITESMTKSGSETISVPTTPTETVVVATKATETIVIGTGATAVVVASLTATIAGGTYDATDTVALTFTNAGVAGSPVTVTYTLGGGETATTIAAGLVALIKANAVLQAANVSASNASSAVITITQQGVIGNSTTWTATVTETGGGTETVTFSPVNGVPTGGAGVVGSALSGGSGPVIPVNNFVWHRRASSQAFWYGKPVMVDYPTLAEMVNQGAEIQ